MPGSRWVRPITAASPGHRFSRAPWGRLSEIQPVTVGTAGKGLFHVHDPAESPHLRRTRRSRGRHCDCSDFRSQRQICQHTQPQGHAPSLSDGPHLPSAGLLPDDGDATGGTTRHYTLTQRLAHARILPRLITPILGYNGIFPGPAIRIDRGTRAGVRVRNKLPAQHPALGHAMPTSMRLHGSASLPQLDGYANDLTMPGFFKDYQYPNLQPARTLRYHDHAVPFPTQNVYSGLAGLYLLNDPVEKDLLPQGGFDPPLIVSDAMFAASGALGYDDREHSGLWGDVILVNGRSWPVLKVQRRVFRFRILNASVSRSYRFTLSTGDPVTGVATDAGLMPAAQTVGSWRHGSAERYEVLIDFRKYAPGNGWSCATSPTRTTATLTTLAGSWPSMSSMAPWTRRTRRGTGFPPPSPGATPWT